MKIAAAQMDIAWHNRRANHAKIRHMAEAAKARGVDLVIFPEMCATGFSMDSHVTAEPLDGPTPTLFRNLARDLHLAVVGGFALDTQGERPRNVSLSVDSQGRDLALYAKIHLIGLLNEDRYYNPGNHTVSFHVAGAEVSCLICYDLRFPEVFRSLAERCSMIVVIASWPSVRQSHWDILLPARAVENQIYVTGVNRVGQGGGHLFTGGSAIIDPAGRVLAHAGNRETLLIAEIDPQQVKEIRSAMPFLKDRRNALFQPGESVSQRMKNTPPP